jgi:hypothetical protein
MKEFAARKAFGESVRNIGYELMGLGERKD